MNAKILGFLAVSVGLTIVPFALATGASGAYEAEYPCELAAIQDCEPRTEYSFPITDPSALDVYVRVYDDSDGFVMFTVTWSIGISYGTHHQNCLEFCWISMPPGLQEFTVSLDPLNIPPSFVLDMSENPYNVAHMVPPTHGTIFVRS